MEFSWIYLDKETPICTETGNWDGKRSDEILVRDYNGKHYVAYCYQGFMDGAAFCDFYSSERDSLIEGITYWTFIPDPI